MPKTTETAYNFGSQRMNSIKIDTIEQRVGLINYYISEGKKDAMVRRLASNILNQRCGNDWCVPEKNWEAEVSAIFYWLRNNVRYTLDPNELELFQRARRSLENRTADCDDQVILAGAILQSVGYPVRIVIIDTGSDEGWNHVYIHVGVPPMGPKKWIAFDLTATKEPLGWEMPNYAVRRKRVFEV